MPRRGKQKHYMQKRVTRQPNPKTPSSPQSDLGYLSHLPELKKVALQGFETWGPGALLMPTLRHNEGDGTQPLYLTGEQAVALVSSKEYLAKLLIDYEPRQEMIWLLPGQEGWEAFWVGFAYSPTELNMDRMLGYIGEKENSRQLTHDFGIDVLYRFNDLLDFVPPVMQAAESEIRDSRFADVFKLSYRLYTVAQTIYNLGRQKSMLVPSFIDSEPMVDFGSAIILLRSAFETYLTMFEVFFAPKTEDEFEYEHAAWILTGFRFLKHNKETSEQASKAREEAIAALDRIRNTQVYSKLKKKPQDPYNFKRKHDFQQSFKEIGFSDSLFNMLYSHQSGYVHADGYASKQIAWASQESVDQTMDFALFTTMILLSKTILDFVGRFPAANQVCLAYPEAFELVQYMAEKAKG